VVDGAPGRSTEQILDGVDAQKLRSSMTLFMWVDADQPVFQQVLDRHFAGLADAATDQRL
jgi:uncharacterized protein (DUF1810 family)